MYAVIFKSSGVVAFRSRNKEQAHYWYECNNFDDEGNDLGLFQIVKEKRNAGT